VIETLRHASSAGLLHGVLHTLLTHTDAAVCPPAPNLETAANKSGYRLAAAPPQRDCVAADIPAWATARWRRRRRAHRSDATGSPSHPAPGRGVYSSAPPAQPQRGHHLRPIDRGARCPRAHPPRDQDTGQSFASVSVVPTGQLAQDPTLLRLPRPAVPGRAHLRHRTPLAQRHSHRRGPPAPHPRGRQARSFRALSRESTTDPLRASLMSTRPLTATCDRTHTPLTR